MFKIKHNFTLLRVKEYLTTIRRRTKQRDADGMFIKDILCKLDLCKPVIMKNIHLLYNEKIPQSPCVLGFTGSRWRKIGAIFITKYSQKRAGRKLRGCLKKETRREEAFSALSAPSRRSAPWYHQFTCHAIGIYTFPNTTELSTLRQITVVPLSLFSTLTYLVKRKNSVTYSNRRPGWRALGRKK